MYLLHRQAYRGRSPGGLWSAPCGQWSCRLPVSSCWASPVASWWWSNRSSHLVLRSSVRNRTQTSVHCPTETKQNIMLISRTLTLLTKHSDIQLIKYNIWKAIFLHMWDQRDCICLGTKFNRLDIYWNYLTHKTLSLELTGTCGAVQ